MGALLWSGRGRLAPTLPGLFPDHIPVGTARTSLSRHLDRDGPFRRSRNARSTFVLELLFLQFGAIHGGL